MNFTQAILAVKSASPAVRSLRYSAWIKRNIFTADEVERIRAVYPDQQTAQEPPLPPIPEQAKNLLHDVGLGILHLLKTGKVLRSDAEIDRIHSICLSNQCGAYRASDDR